MKRLKVKLISPVPDTPGYKGCFPKSMFDINLDDHTCCCPAGELAPDKVFNKKTGELEVFIFSEISVIPAPSRINALKIKNADGPLR